MAAWVCEGCTAVYSVGAPRCPQCGGTKHHESGEKTMAKVTQHGGPSYVPGEEPEGITTEGEAATDVLVGEPEGEESVVDSEELSDDPDGYDAWTVDALKDELRERELPVSGNKAELVERLTEADAASDTPEANAE